MNIQQNSLNFPLFLPDATYGSIKSISFKDLEKTQLEGIVTTTLHIEQKIGSSFIKDFGGLHKFFNWNKFILTDSGGWQVFSLINSKKNKTKNFTTEAGCTFINEDTGKQTLLTPESSIKIQSNLSPDIMTVLDFPILGDATYKDRKECVGTNTSWAKRAKKEFEDIYSKNDKPLLGAVVQGGNDFELRKKSAEELIEIGFDLYNFGGLPLHTPITWKSESSEGFYHEMLEYVSNLLPKDKIKYAMGVGQPTDIAFCVEKGWQIFDTVLPTRNARHGFLYVSENNGDETKSYKSFKHDILRIKNERNKFSDLPVDPNCFCECCTNISRSYLRHLIKINEPTGFRFATIHNLTFYSNWMSRIRKEML